MIAKKSKIIILLVVFFLSLVGLYCNFYFAYTPTYSNNQMHSNAYNNSPSYSCKNNSVDYSSASPKIAWIQSTTSAAFPARMRHTSLVYNNRMWVIGGEGEHGELLNDVWYSSDGAIWIEANGSAEFSGRYDPLSLVYNNRMWVIGGWGVPANSSSGKGMMLNDVWYSSDGNQWNEATASTTFPPRTGATAITYANKMWIIGGENASGIPLNDVWYSSDGVQWYEANASAAFPPRDRATSVAYANKMWIIDGENDVGIPLNDVWYSSDGVQWYEANVSATFPSRMEATSVVYNDRIWIIGGSNGQQSTFTTVPYFNDVWSSLDGSIWTPDTCENISDGSLYSSFQPRESHTSVVYNDRIWIIAGALNMPNNPPFDVQFMNDTWYSDESP